ncbi:MAG: DNA repair protein RecN [Pseudomonadota bacterium]
MLVDLSIRDILLIETLDLTFHPGLNVLTGETGAGKSILLDSLGFVLGWRGRADIVRPGAEAGEVTAVFDLPSDHASRDLLSDAGLPVDDQLVLRRITAADGRKRGFVNDRRASGDVLRALSTTLVELHGQHDDRGLLDPKAHRALLDSYAGADTALAEVQRAWNSLAAARKTRADAEAALAEAARDTEYLRHAVEELNALSPEAGEDDQLDAERRRLQMGDKLREDVTRAARAMGAEGAEARLAEAMRWLEVVAERAEGALDAPLAALSRAMVELSEAQSATEAALRDFDADPYRLEQVEERLFAIRALARKHSVQPDELADLVTDLGRRLAAIDGGDAELARLRQAETAAQDAYDSAAATLRKTRMAAAKRLDTSMKRELAPLKMERAVFETAFDEAEPGPSGRDAVTFEVATNPGAPAGPLGRIASGGELSRFLLALKVCLTGRATGLTMIFDEIDRGVGGATADAVGRRLAQVAKGAQVLVVTHSPQVAALGKNHFLVSKSVRGASTRTHVDHLHAQQRVDEIARMLAGEVITEQARSAAQALLAPTG